MKRPGEKRAVCPKIRENILLLLDKQKIIILKILCFFAVTFVWLLKATASKRKNLRCGPAV